MNFIMGFFVVKYHFGRHSHMGEHVRGSDNLVNIKGRKKKLLRNLYIFKLFNLYIEKLKKWNKLELRYENNILTLNPFFFCLSFSFLVFFSFHIFP